ncbi:MAG: hypothetical protein ABIJ21_06265 [Nanoarchaeota archaeon]
MGASTVKYFLFFALLLAMVGSEVVLNNDSVYDAIIYGETAKGTGLLTGNVVSDQNVSHRSYVPVLVVVFVLCTGYVLFTKKRWWFLEHDASSYVTLLLRSLLGIVIIVLAFDYSTTFVGYALALLKLLFGVLLLIGLFTREISYVLSFYLLSLLLAGYDLITGILLLGIALSLILLGAGPFSVDFDRCEKKARSR